MGEKSLGEVISCIATFLVDRTGNEIFDKWKEKQKIKKILRKDKKNIERIFLTHEGTDLYNLVESFIIFEALKTSKFYSPMSLSEEQEHQLWREFLEYLEKEEGKNKFEINYNYREKIIRCINLHNEEINNMIMDEKSKVHVKVMHSEHEIIRKSLNQIIDTLNTDTPFQDQNNKLGFMVSQIESIMKSYRFDINQLRKLQMVCIGLPMLIMLIMAITIPLSLRYVQEANFLYIVLIFIIAFIALSLIFGSNISHKLKYLEEQMNMVRRSLMHYHIKAYFDLFSNGISLDSLEELEDIVDSLTKVNSILCDNEDLEREVELCIKRIKKIYKKEFNKIAEKHIEI